MKNACLVVVFLTFCIFCGCSTSTTKSMSPEETVRCYFSQFSDKSQSGMDALVYEKMRGKDFDLNHLNSVKLISCTEENDTSKISSNKEWYSNPYKVALVHVAFDINYKSGGSSGGFNNGRYNWDYYLVKENEKSDWIIVQWGK